MPTPARTFLYLDKPRPGDRIAILSPADGLPGLFPEVYEQGLRRLREVFDLVPVEYPTTRTMGAPLRERARDVHAAFSDPDIKAVFCSIGGSDQIKLLKHLDPELLKAHPQPFFGYSDNTNLHLFLWNLGLVSYHGGSIMVQLGRGGAMHPYTVASLRRALFERGEFDLAAAPACTDEYLDWADAGTLMQEPRMYPNSGWRWLNGGRVVEGRAWGGCFQIVDWHLRTGRYLLPPAAYAGSILYLETSEEMPPADSVYRALVAMGEREMLQQFPALLVARPQAWSPHQCQTLSEKAAYTSAQEGAIMAALAEYHPRALVVFNMDFGHTDPQFVVPNGGRIRIDGVEKRIWVTY